MDYLGERLNKEGDIDDWFEEDLHDATYKQFSMVLCEHMWGRLWDTRGRNLRLHADLTLMKEGRHFYVPERRPVS